MRGNRERWLGEFEGSLGQNTFRSVIHKANLKAIQLQSNKKTRAVCSNVSDCCEEAANSTSILECFSIEGPPCHFFFFKSLYEEAHYRAELPYGTTANIPLTRGKKQGDQIGRAHV